MYKNFQSTVSSNPPDESRRSAKRLKRGRTQNRRVAETTTSNPPDEPSHSILKTHLKKRDYYGKTQRRKVAETTTSSQTIPQVDKSNAAKRVRPRRKAEIPQKRRFFETTVNKSGFLLSYKVHVSPPKPKRSRGRPRKQREAETTIDESKFLLNYVSWDDITITDLSGSSTNCNTVTIEESLSLPKRSRGRPRKQREAETTIDESKFLLNYVSWDDIIINDLSGSSSTSCNTISKACRALQFQMRTFPTQKKIILMIIKSQLFIETIS